MQKKEEVRKEGERRIEAESRRRKEAKFKGKGNERRNTTWLLQTRDRPEPRGRTCDEESRGPSRSIDSYPNGRLPVSKESEIGKETREGKIQVKGRKK